MAECGTLEQQQCGQENNADAATDGGRVSNPQDAAEQQYGRDKACQNAQQQVEHIIRWRQS